MKPGLPITHLPTGRGRLDWTLVTAVAVAIARIVD
jgi:hypothetical protein